MEAQELRRRLAQRPNAVRFEELERLLLLCSWRLDRVRGSHHIFKREGDMVVIPLKRPHVRAHYVREVLRATEEIDDGD